MLYLQLKVIEHQDEFVKNIITIFEILLLFKIPFRSTLLALKKLTDDNF